MKYIIEESRLENIIFKYLNGKFEGIERKKGKYSDIVLSLPGEEYGLIGWERPDRLYVYSEIFDEINLMFSMKESDALDVIGRYVESRYNLKVNHTALLEFWQEQTLRVDTI